MSFFLTAIIMFAFWILLSGEMHLLLVASGIVASLLVAAISHDLFIGKVDIRAATARIFRFTGYLPWLLWQVVLANLDLVYRTLHPSMPIDPKIIELDTALETEKGIAVLANSITLTPGTVTIDATKDGKFVVHSIAGAPAESLLSAEMIRRVERIEGGKNV